MGHSLGDGIIVLALAGALVAYWYSRHVERQRRVELAHQERLVAMEKGIPLPELPIAPPSAPRARDPHAVLIHGIVWLAFGMGGMGAAYLVTIEREFPELLDGRRVDMVTPTFLNARIRESVFSAAEPPCVAA